MSRKNKSLDNSNKKCIDKNQLENASEQYFQSNLNFYKELIVKMIEKIEKPHILEYLYTFITLFLEKWG